MKIFSLIIASILGLQICFAEPKVEIEANKKSTLSSLLKNPQIFVWQDSLNHELENQIICMEQYSNVVLQSQLLQAYQGKLLNLALNYRQQEKDWRSLHRINDDNSNILFDIKNASAQLLKSLSSFKREAFTKAVYCSSKYAESLPLELNGALSRAAEDTKKYYAKKKFLKKWLHALSDKKYINDKDTQIWSTNLTMDLWRSINQDLDSIDRISQNLKTQ